MEEKRNVTGYVATSLLVMLFVMLLLPPLYVLSSGPASRVLASETWNAVYSPLRRIRGFSPGAADVLNDYVDWWLELPI